MKITFIAYGTGGSEMFKQLMDNKDKIKANEIKFISISEYALNKNKDSLFINESKIINYIENNKPDLLINERSNGTHIQNKITEYCIENGILNLTILDFYVKDLFMIFSVMPDHIICPSLSIKNQIQKQINYKNIYPLGNPAYDRFFNKKYEFKNNKIIKTLFLGQGELELEIGISRYVMFEHILNTMNKLGIESEFLIKLHPQEGIHEWNQLTEKYANVKILDYDNKNDLILDCYNYDLLISYNSTLSLQGHLIGIPSLFYELGNIEEALINFKNRKIPIQSHPYDDFEQNATDKNIDKINNIILSKIHNK